ncbi:TPA: hypothetical protein ACX369_002501 [Serratia marcescens]|nr:hypothetical protein [Serratia marcescens]
MFIEKLKRKNEAKKKKASVIVLTKTETDFLSLSEPLSLYDVDTMIKHIPAGDLLEFINNALTGKNYFVLDAQSYSETEIADIAMMLRGRYPSMLIGNEDSIQATWHARELGFSSYFTRTSEIRLLLLGIVEHFGYVRSRTSLVIGLCNTSPDIDINYRVFHDLCNSEMMKGYSMLFVNCDIANIFFDAALGVKANKNTVEHVLGYENELDTTSSLKLVMKIKDHFDYVSFNIANDEAHVDNVDAFLNGVEKFIESLANSYGFIFINIPYYFLTLHGGINLLNESDIRVLMTNGQIESIYNLNYLKNRIGFKQDKGEKRRDKLISIRKQAGKLATEITDKEIHTKLGIKVDFNNNANLLGGLLTAFNRKKESKNIIDSIFR